MSVEDPELLIALAKQKMQLDAGRIEFLEGERARYRGELHTARQQLDDTRKALDRCHRFLRHATDRVEHLKASRDRAYGVVDAHADRLDAFAAAAADGNLERIVELARDWRDRE